VRLVIEQRYREIYARVLVSKKSRHDLNSPTMAPNYKSQLR
jgi:hypothetical protein